VEHSDFDKLVKVQLSYWQGVLKLADWAISIDYWPHAAFDGNVSRVHWSRNQKTATIALRVPEDIPPVERDWPDHEAIDYDMSLVHELLHLKCVDMESKVEWAEEQMVNHVTRALVTLYREGHESEEVPSEAPNSPSVAIIGHSTGHYL
jgi:hypothetical protein